MNSTPPTAEVPPFIIDLVTPSPTLAVIPRVRGKSPPPAPPTSPRVQRTSSLQKERDHVALRILETTRKIEKETLKNDASNQGYIDSLLALKSQWEQRFDVLSDDLLSRQPVNYRTDFPSISLRQKSKSVFRPAFHGATEALNNSDTVTTTLLSPTQNLPDNSDDQSNDETDSDDSGSYFDDDDPNFLVNGFHGFDVNNLLPQQNRMNAQDWADFAANQALAITTGFNSISAINFKREIPEFSGDLDESLPIDEWFKIADKVATTAQWTDAQKEIYFKDRLTKSALNFSNALNPGVVTTYAQWRTAMINGFQDTTLRNLRKDQLKLLKQRPTERSRDFKKRIDETYRNAYGADIDDSGEAHVLTLKNDVKKETLLNGLRSEIIFLIWGRLPADATYDQTATVADQCEKIIDVRRTTESRTLGQALETEKKAQKSELDEIKSLVQQMANLQITSLNAAGPAKTIAYIQEDSRERERVRFADRPRGRSDSPGFRSSRPRPTFSQRFDNRRQRSVSPRWENSNREQPQERESRTCYFCKHKGHIKRECRKLKALQEGQRSSYQGRRQSPAPNFRRN